jgi:hypothetical protein
VRCQWQVIAPPCSGLLCDPSDLTCQRLHTAMQCDFDYGADTYSLSPTPSLDLASRQGAGLPLPPTPATDASALQVDIIAAHSNAVQSEYTMEGISAGECCPPLQCGLAGQVKSLPTTPCAPAVPQACLRCSHDHHHYSRTPKPLHTTAHALCGKLRSSCNPGLCNDVNTRG